MESFGQDEPDEFELSAFFAGQVNGLCGAAVPGKLFLVTGMHSGYVGFTIELYDGRPPLDDTWEEIVEASFRPTTSEVALVEWADEDWFDLDLAQIDYRVRYCATGMQEGNAKNVMLDDDKPVVDRYLLQFWPCAPSPDRIVKQTTDNATYWHDYAVTQGRA